MGFWVLQGPNIAFHATRSSCESECADGPGLDAGHANKVTHRVEQGTLAEAMIVAQVSAATVCKPLRRCSLRKDMIPCYIFRSKASTYAALPDIPRWRMFCAVAREDEYYL